MGLDIVTLSPHWPAGLLAWLAIVGCYSWASWAVARRWGPAVAVGFGVLIGLALAAGSGAAARSAAESGAERTALAIGGVVAAAVVLWPALAVVTLSGARRAAASEYDHPRPSDIGSGIGFAGVTVLLEFAAILLLFR